MKKTKFIVRLLILVISAVFISAALFSCSDEEDIEYIELPAPITILRSDSADKAITDATVKLRTAIEEKTGTRPELTTDWVKRGDEIPDITEGIVVGKTNRTASTEASERLTSARPNNTKDWSLTEYNGTLLICGGSSSAIDEAVEYVMENYIIDGVVKIPLGLDYLYQYQYPDLKIGSTSVFEYSIPENKFAQLAPTNEYLRDKISRAAENNLPSESDKLIRLELDTALTADTYSIEVTDTDTIISGGSFDAVRAGADKFYDLLIAGSITDNYNNKETMLMNKLDTKKPTITGSCTPIGNPIYLIDDSGHFNSGWDSDYTATGNITLAAQSQLKGSRLFIDDKSTTEKCSLNRKFNVQSNGVMTLETKMGISELDGFEIAIKDTETGRCAVKLTAENGAFVDKSTPDKIIRTLKGTNSFRITIDLDNKKYSLTLNGIDHGEFNFSEPVDKVDMLSIETTDEAVVTINPINYVFLCNNIPIEERFLHNSGGEKPSGFEVSGDCKITSEAEHTLALIGGNEPATAKKSFKAFDGLAIYEMLFFASDYTGGTEIALMSGSKVAAAFTIDDRNICYNDIALRSYTTDFWYTLRLEADTRTGKVEVKINGKSLGYADFIEKVTSFDSIRVTNTSGRIEIDDVKVYQYIRPDDYVPAPLSSGSESGGVGLQVCSLWKNGSHWGWDVITPYDELKPLLGYYDEVNTETADWEIKYMAEHGVDFQLYCWYASYAKAPQKKGGLGNHLHDGYFNAEYSDQMKFAIMWENANGSHPENAENFRKYIVPYWVEYYLTDPRYYVIDNKPVITVFSESDLIKDFGSAASVKKEFDYLREVCRGLGFDDAIILCQSTSQDGSWLKQTDSFGADAIYAYNWGKSYKSEIYERNILNQSKYTKVVPTISVGFNNIAWAGTPSPMIDHDDYKSALEWVRDEYHPQYANDIQSKLVILSTWNEYGEGTYIMPSIGHGFAYMDAVHDVFAPNNKYENIVPTESQKSRICQMFVQDRSILRPNYSEEVKFDPELYEAKYSIDFKNGAAGFSVGFAVDNFRAENGAIKGSSTKNDFAVMSPNNLTVNGEAVDAAEIKYIKVRMKSSSDGTAEVFFITDTETTYDQGKSASAVVTASDDFVDYYFDFTRNSAFTGTIKQIRIDPLASPCEFEIESVEFIRDKNVYALKTGDTENIISGYAPQSIDGVIMLPIDVSKAVHTMLGCTYEWKKAEGKLSLTRKGNTLVLQVGSDIAYLNGQEQKLSHTVESFDGLPLVPYDDIESLLKLECRLVKAR